MQKAVTKFLKIGTLISTWGLIATVLLQIVCRFSWFNTPPWTEEASRILFIYAVAFASGLAMKGNGYVHLDLFYNAFSPRLKRALNLVIPTVICVLFVFFCIYALKFVVLGLAEKSPSMGFKMALAFGSMFVLGLSICYFSWFKMRAAFKNRVP